MIFWGQALDLSNLYNSDRIQGLKNIEHIYNHEENSEFQKLQEFSLKEK